MYHPDKVIIAPETAGRVGVFFKMSEENDIFPLGLLDPKVHGLGMRSGNTEEKYRDKNHGKMTILAHKNDQSLTEDEERDS